MDDCKINQKSHNLDLRKTKINTITFQLQENDGYFSYSLLFHQCELIEGAFISAYEQDFMQDKTGYHEGIFYDDIDGSI